MEPTNATALHNRGSLHERAGRPDAAIADFTAAIAADPCCAASYNARGVLLLGAGRAAEAAADLDAAVSLSAAGGAPSAALLRNRAQARRELGDHHGAVQVGAGRRLGKGQLVAGRQVHVAHACAARLLA